MGIIMLVGLVVNNSIILYEYIQQYREEHNSGNSIEEYILLIQRAGKDRIRPIVLTTLTTVLGLIPMGLGIGEGAEIQSSMAIVVIFGLLGSSLITLIYFPVFFTTFELFKSRIRR